MARRSPLAVAKKLPPAASKTAARRKPLLDEAKRRRICSILALGGTRELAAFNVGCSRATIVRTMRRDPAFAQQVWEAETDAEILFLRTLKTKQWRSAAWALERLFPSRYARRAADTITRAQLADLLRMLGRRLATDTPRTAPAAEQRRAQAQIVRDGARNAPFKKDPLAVNEDPREDKMDEQKP